MSDLLQYHYRVPMFDAGKDTGEIEKRVNTILKRGFADALLERALDSIGGLVVGPIHRTERDDVNWFNRFDKVKHFSIYANVEELPELPEFELIGGPWHKRIVRSDGARYFRVPMPVNDPSAYSPSAMFEPTQPITVAVYERIGDSSSYRFERVERA